MKLQWTNVYDIGFELSGAHPEVDPLSVRFTELHRLITDLPDFEDDPMRSNEKILEAPRRAWLEEWN